MIGQAGSSSGVPVTRRALVGRGSGGLLILFLQLFLRVSRVAVTANSTTPDPVVGLDAFIPAKCGKAELREWQARQRAFDCEPFRPGRFRDPSEPNAITGPGSTSIREITSAELPFYAHLIIDRDTEEQVCAGALIDYEYIITTAQCVHEARKIDIIVGTSHVRGLRGHEISADKWCLPREHNPEAPLRDVAIVRIREQDRLRFNSSIQPACLKLDRRPNKRTACFMGRKRTNSTANSLQAHVVRRSSAEPLDLPYYARYLDDHQADPCEPEPGAPVFCYDACETNSSRVRAYVVALESSRPELASSCLAGASPPIYYTDLARTATLIREMIRSMLRDSTHHSLECSEPAAT